MSKYDEFIKNLNQEVDNMEVTNVSTYVKVKHQELKKPKFSVFKPKLIPLTMFSVIIVLIFILTIGFFNDKTTKPTPNPPKVPTIATSVDDAYAFEIMAAGNFLYSNTTNNTKGVRRKMLAQSRTNFNDVTTKINEHYLTIKQMLTKEKLNYEIIQIDSELYENKMIINPSFSTDFDLKYTIYFNKTKVQTKDDDEELFNLDGIITIDGKTYEISGEIETEDDEIETKIKVVTGDNEYFIIEQEKEENEEEFVYTSFVNGKKQNEYAISYEVEDNEIEIKIEIRVDGKTEKLTAKIENNKIILKVNFTSYQGKIEVIDELTTIKYHFIKENITIEKKLIKN